MINTPIEHECALEEVAYLKAWIDRLDRKSPGVGRDMTRAGVQRMLKRISDEIAEYEDSTKLVEASASAGK